MRDKLIIDVSVGSMQMHIETEDFETFVIITTDNETHEIKTEKVSKIMFKNFLNTLLI